MESVVKNCGQTVHDEVANKQTMEELKELLKVGALGVLSEGRFGCSAAILSVCGQLQREEQEEQWSIRGGEGKSDGHLL